MKRYFYFKLCQPFCTRSKAIYDILVKGIFGNIYVKLFQIWTSGSGGDFA